MRAELVPLLRCPESQVVLHFEGNLQPWIEEGTLVCPQGCRYPIKRGMPHIYVDDAFWQPKAREAIGWVKYHQDRHIYNQTGVDIDFQLPFFPHDPWIDIAHQFNIALALAKPQPGEWVLDVGAGRSWAAKQFAVRGCHAVAIDIVDDDQVGLGRSRALMQQANVVYDALIADSERLPFAPASFDLVFCSAALHHTTNLEQLMQNISRVLKRGGRMVAINEPCVEDTSDDQLLRRTVLAEELAYGINETRPRLADYRRALRLAGLQEQALFPWHAWHMPHEQVVAWAAGMGVQPPQAVSPTSAWHTQRLLPWQHDTAEQSTYEWTDAILQQRGGAMLLLATK
jgi:SAM-dependent methyltransferase